MKYYKVRAEKDGVRRVQIGKDGRREYAGEYIAGELYTGKEIAKYANGKNVVDPVDIPRSGVYWFFGARFAE